MIYIRITRSYFLTILTALLFLLVSLCIFQAFRCAFFR